MDRFDFIRSLSFGVDAEVASFNASTDVLWAKFVLGIGTRDAFGQAVFGDPNKRAHPVVNGLQESAA